MDAIRAAEKDAPTTELLAGAVGDRCANCEAPLASDQRYCLNCGERRGKARFTFALLAAGAVPGELQPPALPPRRSRFSGGTTLVAGVATLLLAMGVGVLIGHDSNTTTTRASSPIVINPGAGTGAGSAATSGIGGTASTAGTARSRHGKAVKSPKVHLTPKVTQAANQAASKVLGSSGNLTPNVTQQQGSSCSGGAGCQGGKFTGNFFGGG